MCALNKDRSLPLVAFVVVTESKATVIIRHLGNSLNPKWRLRDKGLLLAVRYSSFGKGRRLENYLGTQWLVNGRGRI